MTNLSEVFKVKKREKDNSIKSKFKHDKPKENGIRNIIHLLLLIITTQEKIVTF